MPKQNKKDDLWVYVLLQSALVILLESLKTYNFTIYNTDITYVIPILPIVFLITNYIIKKYNSKKAFISILISGISPVIYMYIMSFALNKTLILTSIIGEVVAYLISQIINIIIYTYILKNTKHSYITILLTYLFSSVFFYITYTIFYLNVITLDGYWKKYLLSISIQFVVSIPLTIIDKKIKSTNQ